MELMQYFRVKEKKCIKKNANSSTILYFVFLCKI